MVYRSLNKRAHWCIDALKWCYYILFIINIIDAHQYHDFYKFYIVHHIQIHKASTCYVPAVQKDMLSLTTLDIGYLLPNYLMLLVLSKNGIHVSCLYSKTWGLLL